jgi:hypothetical protein
MSLRDRARRRFIDGRLVVEARGTASTGAGQGIAAVGNSDPLYLVVSVTDADGVPVSGLAATDFTIDTPVVAPGGSLVEIASAGGGQHGDYSLDVVPVTYHGTPQPDGPAASSNRGDHGSRPGRGHRSRPSATRTAIALHRGRGMTDSCSSRRHRDRRPGDPFLAAAPLPVSSSARPGSQGRPLSETTAAPIAATCSRRGRGAAFAPAAGPGRPRRRTWRRSGQRTAQPGSGTACRWAAG